MGALEEMILSLDEIRSLLDDRRHIRQSLDRIIRGADVQNQVQERVHASMALIERVQARWSTKLPTLPKLSDTSPTQKNLSAIKSNVSSD
jgi:uncharacterized protein (DUF2342 family)